MFSSDWIRCSSSQVFFSSSKKPHLLSSLTTFLLLLFFPLVSKMGFFPPHEQMRLLLPKYETLLSETWRKRKKVAKLWACSVTHVRTGDHTIGTEGPHKRSANGP